MSTLKSKILSTVAVASVALTSFGGMAVTHAASYTGSLTNVMVAGDTSAADTLNNTAFGGMVNTIYSTIAYLLSFVFQATVLSTIVALGVIAVIAGYAWTHMKRKFMGGGSKKKR